MSDRERPCVTALSAHIGHGVTGVLKDGAPTVEAVRAAARLADDER
jgi:hypothetical protein